MYQGRYIRSSLHMLAEDGRLEKGDCDLGLGTMLTNRHAVEVIVSDV
jgi:hypothetical protein